MPPHHGQPSAGPAPRTLAAKDNSMAHMSKKSGWNVARTTSPLVLRASCKCRSATCSWYWFWRRRADARIRRPSTPMTTRHASGTDSPREQTDLSPARCACKDHAEEQLISHNGRAHPRAAAASARLLPHLAGRPARPAFESMRERADILVTEQPRNLGNRQAFVRQMALGEI
jgi:hypothetical protein